MRRLLGVLREDAVDSEPGTADNCVAGVVRDLATAPAADARVGATTAGRGTTTADGAASAAGAGASAGGGGVRASRQPQPGLAQLAELIDAAREASMAGTRLIISGRVAPLDPGVELAAYRIVQEALTNVALSPRGEGEARSQEKRHYHWSQVDGGCRITCFGGMCADR